MSETTPATAPAPTEAPAAPTPPAEAAPVAPATPEAPKTPAKAAELARAIQAQRAADARQKQLEAQAKALADEKAAIEGRKADLERFGKLQGLAQSDKVAAVLELVGGEEALEGVLQGLTDYALKKPGAVPVKLPAEVQEKLARLEALEKEVPEFKKGLEDLKKAEEARKATIEAARVQMEQDAEKQYLDGGWKGLEANPAYELLRVVPGARQRLEDALREEAASTKKLPDYKSVADKVLALVQKDFEPLLQTAFVRERVGGKSKDAPTGPSTTGEPLRTVTSQRGDPPASVEFDKLPLKKRLALVKEGKVPR